MSRLLDASVLLSFDRTGYRRHAAAFDPSDLQVDLAGRVCLVTGANSGIGFETALALAAAAPTCGCCAAIRSAARRRGARCVSGPGRRVHLDVLDVAEPGGDPRGSARGSAAGRSTCSCTTPASCPTSGYGDRPTGTSSRFATHVAGTVAAHEAAAAARCERSRDGRASCCRLGRDVHAGARRWPSDWNGARVPTTASSAYAADQAHAGGAGRSCSRRNSTARLVRAVQRHASRLGGHAGGAHVAAPLLERHARVLRTPAEGADTVVWLAASAAARGQSGRFWFDRQARSTHLLPWTRERLKDRQALRRLCERLAG